MRVLSLIFTTMKWFGIWRSIEWSLWKKKIYRIYTMIIIIILSLTSLSKIIYLVKFVNDVDEIANSLFLFLTEICIIYKIINILNNRRDIIKFVETLNNDLGKANDAEEIRIQHQFDRWIAQNLLSYDALVGTTIFVTNVVNYRNNVPRRTLAYNACFPFDHSTEFGYPIAYLCQVIALGLYGILCIAYDALFCCLMGQACAQLRILQYRLQSMQNTVIHYLNINKNINDDSIIEEIENKVLQRCIRHHHDILKYTKSINEVFGGVIFFQSAISTFVLCCSIYMLSQMKKFSPEFASMAAYSISMLTQIFLYCWYGNEVTLESVDIRNAVYGMEWTSLKVRTQKNLLLPMVRTLEPIKFTSANIIVLSLDTYKSLVKLSYSMYNLLQRTSK